MQLELVWQSSEEEVAAQKEIWIFAETSPGLWLSKVHPQDSKLSKPWKERIIAEQKVERFQELT